MIFILKLKFFIRLLFLLIMFNVQVMAKILIVKNAYEPYHQEGLEIINLILNNYNLIHITQIKTIQERVNWKDFDLIFSICKSSDFACRQWIYNCYSQNISIITNLTPNNIQFLLNNFMFLRIDMSVIFDLDSDLDSDSDSDSGISEN